MFQNCRVLRTLVFPASLFCCADFASAQAPIPTGTSGLAIDFVAAPQDFLIPSALDGARIEMKIRGADGGAAMVGPCESDGGEGASAVGQFRIGTDPGQLAPGGILRFLTGQRGR